MYNIDELNMQLLSDLRKIAEDLGVKSFKRLAKQELIYAILEAQATTPEKDLPKKKEAAKKPSEDKPKRPKRVNVKKEAATEPTGKKEIDEEYVVCRLLPFVSSMIPIIVG